MPSITTRDYAGPDDLRAMQALTQRLWSFDEHHHIGGLAWQRYEHVGREPEWPTRLWEVGGDVVAWAWLYERNPDVLYVQVDPAHPRLMDEALDWYEKAATADCLEVAVFERENALRAALIARGFTRDAAAPFGLFNRRTLENLPPLIVPDGHRVLSMAEAPDPDRRAAAHRAAWSRIAGREHLPPGRSRVTGESYRNVMAAWPYRPELDWVLEDPDGHWVANCCVWLDEANSVAEFEPVGVDADFRRRGLGYVVCLAGLHALKQAGARTAIVGSRGDDDYPVPRRLYFSLGFKTYATSEVLTRKRPQSTS
jgi:GNAT superfamily N-acetyltransferase